MALTTDRGLGQNLNSPNDVRRPLGNERRTFDERRWHLYRVNTSRKLCNVSSLFVLAMLGFTPEVGLGEVIWSGDFDDGTFASHAIDPQNITFFGTPPYGRPMQYGGQNSSHVGNGDLMWLTADRNDGNYRAGPRRGNNPHALGIFVKSEAGGGVEPDDCDSAGKNCSKRRAELRSWTKHWEEDLVPYLSERWASISVYVPSDYEQGGSGSGPLVWQWKMQQNNSSTSPPLAVYIMDGSWEVTHRWSEEENPTTNENRLRFDFSRTSPTDSNNVDLMKFLPDPSVSRAALGNLNRGGWTDFVMQIRFDGREPDSGGHGYVNLWMRPDDGQWVHVLNIYASVTRERNNSEERAHGVLYKGSGSGARYGFVATAYMDKTRVWDLSGNGYLFYFDNMKLGSESATFSQMSPDGSSPGTSAAGPKAPELAPVQ